MKRCIFSGTKINEFRYRHGGEDTCYECHERESDHEHVEEFKKTLKIEELLREVAAAIEIKKKLRKNKHYRKRKVDRRIIEKGIIPPDDTILHDFKLRPKAEGPMRTMHN